MKITYLGVYDTVGAVGWDALAIPGIRSRLALHHNMRPTTLIQRCRHALAIDEHRSSFTAHAVCRLHQCGLRRCRAEAHRIGSHAAEQTHADPMASLSSAWTKRIEQRWFVGAHANVGGGYESNPLAQQPLAWLLDGARESGLICDQFPKNGPPDHRLGPRDSFVEFAKPYWTTALRAKRTYRVLDPDPEIRADRRQRKESSAFMLVNINEQIDPSAIEYWAQPDGRRSSAQPRRVRAAEEVPREGPRHARRQSAEAPVDGRRVSARTWCSRSGPRWPRPESWRSIWSFASGSRLAAGVVAGDRGGRVHAGRLGGELSELHDGGARRRARAARVSRLHLLDPRALRRPVRVRRHRRDRVVGTARHERDLTRRRLAEVPGSHRLFRHGRHRGWTGRRPRRRLQSSLFALLVATRLGGDSGRARHPAGHRPADSARDRRCLRSLAHRRARARRPSRSRAGAPGGAIQVRGPSAVAAARADLLRERAHVGGRADVPRASRIDRSAAVVLHARRRSPGCLDRWCTMLRGHAAATCAMSAVVREALYPGHHRVHPGVLRPSSHSGCGSASRSSDGRGSRRSGGRCR